MADVVAKTYRAVPDPPPVVFSRLNASLLPAIYEASEEHTTVADILERISMRELLTEGWRGLVMVKEGQQPIKYAGPVKKDPMISWVYTKHFNALVRRSRALMSRLHVSADASILRYSNLQEQSFCNSPTMPYTRSPGHSAPRSRSLCLCPALPAAADVRLCAPTLQEEITRSNFNEFRRRNVRIEFTPPLPAPPPETLPF